MEMTLRSSKYLRFTFLLLLLFNPIKCEEDGKSEQGEKVKEDQIIVEEQVQEESTATKSAPKTQPPVVKQPSLEELRTMSEIHYKNNDNEAIELHGFESCEPSECNQICGSRDVSKSFCEPKNNKLCMCSMEKFMSSNVEGLVVPVNRENPSERNCSVACNIRNSYARIWHRSDYSKTCSCLLNQVTKLGLTICDEFALQDHCKSVCKSESARCAFNGVCLCRQSWKSAFKNELEHVRLEQEADKQECSKRCKEYNTEYVGRIWDTKNQANPEAYEFREKFCLCGEEVEAEDTALMEKLHNQGFQECTGLKCKVRCGMNNDAKCEPKFRRACLCPRQNIFIGKYLWSRLPTRKETVCVEACVKNGLAPRVIEWNPFFDSRLDWTNGVYRTSRFPYLYDGKFCHCVNLKNEPDMNQFRPCTNELCRWLCGHSGATCDVKTRRYCVCNTHQMVGGLGRRPDPGEYNCNVVCRRNLNDARILDVNWDIPAPHWSVSKAKFCGCIRLLTPAGFTHCEGLDGRDLCPKMCNSTKAYCTRDKVCECGLQTTNPLNNPMVRLPDGKEAEECNEVCRSWTWPLTEDTNHKGYIYDEGRAICSMNNSCPPVDTTPWQLSQPGALSVQMDALEMNIQSGRKFCLCVRNDTVSNQPGVRLPFTMEPPRLSKTLPCIFNYTCIAVTETIHIVA